MSLKTIAPPSPWPGRTFDRSSAATATSSWVPCGVFTSAVIAPPVPAVETFTSESVMSRTPPWALKLTLPSKAVSVPWVPVS